ncbi:hypothetical protein BXY85_0762 [Roseivirga pacifica]|uniref:Uncharacterized protein n=1 Tax=Roseivirga pacifica TaxID=1267423 RepID=A0A1I0RJQ8_9BACT|nr:hypothetical protein [Roseivirga pacifica]RKQ49768.1 hypothetical protein BXY85_0762 [Roseivirga pacifica]SEW41216.1 hypothetical protein SAMN05216290_3708 [Roseivirga pacifica]
MNTLSIEAILLIAGLFYAGIFTFLGLKLRLYLKRSAKLSPKF